MVDITATKEMWSVSVSQSKVLRFLSTGQGLFVMDLGVKNIFDAKYKCLRAY